MAEIKVNINIDCSKVNRAIKRLKRRLFFLKIQIKIKSKIMPLIKRLIKAIGLLPVLLITFPIEMLIYGLRWIIKCQPFPERLIFDKFIAWLIIIPLTFVMSCHKSQIILPQYNSEIISFDSRKAYCLYGYMIKHGNDTILSTSKILFDKFPPGAIPYPIKLNIKINSIEDYCKYSYCEVSVSNDNIDFDLY